MTILDLEHYYCRCADDSKICYEDIAVEVFTVNLEIILKKNI